MSIKQEMISGIFWSAVQKYSGLIIQIFITAVLARLLTPEDFGIVAIATILITFFNLFTELGIGSAIIQKQNLTPQDINSIFTLSIWGGILLAILFFFASTPIANFYQNKALIPICQFLSLNILFAAWNIVPNALICKNKRFKFIAKRTRALQIICGIISILAAYHGMGLYTLLITPIFTTIGVFIVNIRQYPLTFCLHVQAKSIKKIFSYSIFQFLFNFTNYFSRNLDKLIIGRYFSMEELGYYEKSYRLMTLPLQYVTNVITPVMHPILTSLQNDYKDLTHKYNKIIKLIATISFPLGTLLYFTAEDIINIVYGSRWENAIPVFQILALSVPLQMILSTIGAIYQAAGKTNWMFYGGLSNTFCTISGFIIAAMYFDTINSIAWAWDIALLINSFISYLILYKIVLKSPFREIIYICLNPLLCASVLTAFLFIFDFYWHWNIYIISFTLKTLIAIICTGVFIHITKQYNLHFTYTQIKKKLTHQ